MKNDDLNFYRYLYVLDNFSKYDNGNYKEIITLFNEFVSSNRNFVYNKTYLNDSIDKFSIMLKIYASKKKKLLEFQQFMKDENLFPKNYYIIADHIFLIKKDKIITCLSELEKIVKSKNNSKKLILTNEIELFNLYNFTTSNIIINYYNKNFTKYSDILYISENFNLIKQTLTILQESDKNDNR